MDQVSNRSGVGSDDITDDTSLPDLRWSSDEDSSDVQTQCLAAPQPPVPTYKQRLEEFKKLFKELPETERLLVDYPCALQRDILLQGRIYLSVNWVCFYSNVFRGTKITLTLKNITNMTREKTARFIPNAIQICTSTDKFFFTSFSAREKSYREFSRMWENTLLGKSLTSHELWQTVRQHYGFDLGLSYEEMDSSPIIPHAPHDMFMDARKITNITSTAWQKDSSGNMKRSLNYTITINNPLIGKFSTATEYQTLYKESRDGQYYLINSEVYTHDVPYHDYFYTQTRYYIMSNSKRKCRLRVYTDVKYKKQPWGLVKSFITKNSWSGIEENFRHLEAELLEEEAEMNQGGGEAGKMGGLRRRRRTYSRTLAEHSKPKKQYRHDAEQHREGNMGTDAFLIMKLQFMKMGWWDHYNCAWL
uniref:VASt domain-containing protein n=1 Tax=Astatotilapia calliptera TaxID=8154 RepID=A0AAX7V5Z6_ASTCA